MKKLNKNDRVKIINTSTIWKDKEAIVISQDAEEFNEDGLDISNVTVKVLFDPENLSKIIVQDFPRYCLELATKNESINEFYVKSDTELTLEEFKQYFIGSSCKFNGFNYLKLFKAIKKPDGSITYSDEDLEYIKYYEELEKLKCYISACTLSDSFDSTQSLQDNFNSAYWDVEFENGDMLPAISGESLTLLNFKFESLCESSQKVEDYIKDYVYTETLDTIIPSWFFIDKIAAAENIKADKVLKDAQSLGYTIYRISASNFEKLAVAADKCSREMLIDDYADYLHGNMEVVKI